jgi:histidinol-phosphate/aromatic aminotransferase/cobyric acid decarboxylase-like protein
VEREVLGDLIRRHPEQTFWVDETYIDFATIATGRNQSLEDLNLPNLVVCKSLSKFYGLSGLRVGYLVADENRVSDWDVFSPPWSVGLIGQVAGVLALQSDPYYRARAIETHEYARDLEEALVELEFRVVPTSTNFVFAQRSGVKELCARLAERGVFVRDASSLSPRFADEWLRIAVKAPEQQDRLIAELRSILG